MTVFDAYHVYVDGSGSTTTADKISWGAVVVYPADAKRVPTVFSGSSRPVCCNGKYNAQAAEFLAILQGIRATPRNMETDVVVYTDFEPFVLKYNQMKTTCEEFPEVPLDGIFNFANYWYAKQVFTEIRMRHCVELRYLRSHNKHFLNELAHAVATFRQNTNAQDQFLEEFHSFLRKNPFLFQRGFGTVFDESDHRTPVPLTAANSSVVEFNIPKLVKYINKATHKATNIKRQP